MANHQEHPEPTGEAIRRAVDQADPPSGRRSEADLHVCAECSSRLVYPTQWAPVDLRKWRVELRCPECETWSENVYDQPDLDRFDALLDQGTQSLMADLHELQEQNMRADLHRLTVALADDQILPEDF